MRVGGRQRISGLATVLAFGLAGAAAADTLVLRSGERVEGTLVGVRGDTIEFESGRNRRVEHYDRDDVRRIEFDSYGVGDRGDSGGSSGRPSGLRERAVSVSASDQWTDTGIQLRRGQEVYFTASGRVRWGRDRQDGPAGERGSPRNPNRPIPDRPGGSLIDASATATRSSSATTAVRSACETRGSSSSASTTTTCPTTRGRSA